MYFADHPPPHFHARYSGDEALIVIETGAVFAGSLLPLGGVWRSGLGLGRRSTPEGAAALT
jgi:hypothetical protein